MAAACCAASAPGTAQRYAWVSVIALHWWCGHMCAGCLHAPPGWVDHVLAHCAVKLSYRGRSRGWGGGLHAGAKTGVARTVVRRAGDLRSDNEIWRMLSGAGPMARHEGGGGDAVGTQQ